MSTEVISTFYDNNWTVLQKIKYLEKFFKTNGIDISQTYTISFDTNNKVIVNGKNYLGEDVTLETTIDKSQLKGDKGDTGNTGATGAPGRGIVNIVIGTPYEQNEYTITPVEFRYTDGTSTTLNFKAKNGNNLDAETLLEYIEGSETIVVDLAESGDKIEIHLDGDVINKIDNSLQLPLTTPTVTELVGIGTDNAQKRITLGNGLAFDSNTLKASGGKLYSHKLSLTLTDESFLNIYLTFISTTDTRITTEQQLVDCYNKNALINAYYTSMSGNGVCYISGFYVGSYGFGLFGSSSPSTTVTAKWIASATLASFNDTVKEL